MESTLDGQLPLHITLMNSSNCQPSLISFLIEKCPDALYRKDVYGQLPLHKAASNRRINVDVFDFVLNSYPGGACMKDLNG